MARLTNLGSRVAAQAPRVMLAPKLPDPFYSSKEWRALVRKVKRERGNWCQRCGSSDRVIADHIIERRDGGADLDETNIELLCQAHHAVKTAEARKGRARRRT